MGRLEAEDGRYLLVFAVAFALADSRVPTASFLLSGLWTNGRPHFIPRVLVHGHVVSLTSMLFRF